ncbi:MAG TPA: Crp/Fnr family transcriptional regulator [Flavobacterium sp.]|jgi:hypothetical protein|nr:Crp/Fnr family transcriptional regulator [Flavobacterium sp.]
MEQLIRHIEKSVPLTPEEKEIITTTFHSKTVAKKEILHSEGSVCQYNYFITKGCFRLYLITENGKEQVIQFGLENWWITDYSSYTSGRPSKFYIQALERSEVLYISRSEQETLFEKIPALEGYFRKNLERAYAASLTRIEYLFLLSGEERYLQFVGTYPEFAQRIPQYILASFLGISPEYVSEVRKKLG